MKSSKKKAVTTAAVLIAVISGSIVGLACGSSLWHEAECMETFSGTYRLGSGADSRYIGINRDGFSVCDFDGNVLTEGTCISGNSAVELRGKDGDVFGYIALVDGQYYLDDQQQNIAGLEKLASGSD